VRDHQSTFELLGDLLPVDVADEASAVVERAPGRATLGCARDRLVARLHECPDDVTASRVLAVVSTLLASSAACTSPSQDRIRDLGCSWTTRGRARLCAALRNLAPMLGQEWRHAMASLRSTALDRSCDLRGAVGQAREWRRVWLSIDGLVWVVEVLGRLWSAALRLAWLGVRVVAVAVLGGVVLALGLAGLVQGAQVIVAAHHYTPDALRLSRLAEPATLYAADGSTLATLGLQDREPASYDEIPKMLVDAVVATEDRTFWDNPGFDLGALARALIADIKAGRIVEGGSTITEQLVKNRLLDPKHDAGRKVHEIVLAARLAHTYSKQRILTEYLNTVYFGEGAYGVKSAARRFFLTTDPASALPRGKRLDELTLPDTALLAGLIASPTTYDPFDHPARAATRRALVLDTMVDNGYITRAQADHANAAPLPTVRPVPDLRPHDAVVADVQQQLLSDARLGATPQQRRTRLLTGGLRVDTTIDPAAQARALDAIHTILPDQPPFTGALVAVDPATGYVRAMVAGVSFDELQYNLATHPPGRQPGSTYKIITLAAALEAGYSPNDTLNGTSPCTAFRPGYPAWNTTNAEPGGGTISLRDATTDSVNCAYAHLIASLGPPAVIDMAHRLGITQSIPNYLPITLGVKEATPLEMATVAATLAADGIRHNPVFVTRVETPEGRVLIDNTNPQGQRVVAPEIIDCETDILREVISHGTGFRAQLGDGRDVAGKTGTTDDHGDAWFAGYTPQLATVVWMGAPTSRAPMTDVGGIEVFGGTYPARIWKTFMDAQLADQPAINLPPPGPVCDQPGATITDNGRGQPAAPPTPVPPTSPPQQRPQPHQPSSTPTPPSAPPSTLPLITRRK
jgi:membrane peptidoglycan carboxypeptidase